jgi:hypothetical protein
MATRLFDFGARLLRSKQKALRRAEGLFGFWF